MVVVIVKEDEKKQHEKQIKNKGNSFIGLCECIDLHAHTYMHVC